MAAQADNVEALQLLVELTCAKHNATVAAEKAAQLEDGDNASLESSTVASHNEDDSLSFLSSVFDPLQVPAVAVFLNQASRNLTTPLHMAVLNNSMRVLHLLLHTRVKVDFADSSGDTALHKAGRLQLNLAYQALLEAGASQALKNNFGETPRDLQIDNPTY
jgi:ankyrin repeat protein